MAPAGAALTLHPDAAVLGLGVDDEAAFAEARQGLLGRITASLCLFVIVSTFEALAWCTSGELPMGAPCAPKRVPGRVRPLAVHGWTRGTMPRGLAVRMQPVYLRCCAPVTRGHWAIHVLALIALLISVAIVRRASL